MRSTTGFFSRVAALLLVGLLTACGSGGQEQALAAANAPAGSELAELYAKARAAGESTVVVYSSTVDTEFEPLWLEFQKDFPGIRVIYMMVTSAQMVPRMAAERVTGSHMVDLLLQTVDVLPELKKNGDLEPWRPASAARLAEGFSDADDHYHYVLSKLYGLAYNTKRVKPEELPREFDDLNDEQWRGAFTFVQPLGPVQNTDTALATLLREQAITVEQMENLRDNGSYAMPEAGVSYVAQGRQKLNLWSYLPPLVRQQELGAPIDIRFVPDFSIRVPYGLAIARNAPHPAAARLLKAWLFTPRGQQALAEHSHMLGTMPDAPAPALFAAAGKARLLYTTSEPAELLRELQATRSTLAEVFLKPKRVGH